MVINALLCRAGHTVVAVSNGLEAMDAFRSFSGRIDVVLTDLRMPFMDGNELVSRVREVNNRMKIICMSAFPDATIPESTGFLRKPFDNKTLLASIDELLDQG